MASAGSPTYLPYLMNFIVGPGATQTIARTSRLLLVELPARAIRILTLLRLPRFLRVVAALLTTSDASMRPQAFEDHFCCGRRRSRVLVIADAEFSDVLHQPLDFRKLFVAFRGRRQLRQFQFAAQFKPLNHWLEADFAESLAENAPDCRTNQFASDRVRAFELAFVFELKLAGDRWQRRVNIGDARDAALFAGTSGALLCAADRTLQSRDRQSLADAGAFVNALVFARLERDLFDHLAQIIGDIDLPRWIAADPRFLIRDGHAFCHRRRIVGANLSADAILQGSDDLSARGIVLRVRREYDKHVERQSQRVAFNLDVAFLHDIEQTDLNLAREVRQFVDRENAAVRARQQAVVNGQFIRQVASTACRPNRIDVADDVGDRYVRSRELLDETQVARHPRDRSRIAFCGDLFFASAAERRERIVINLAPSNHWNLGVQQIRQPAQNPALRLPPQPQQNEIVPRQQGIHDLRNNGVFVAVHARK